MSRVGVYQAIATRHGTVIVRADAFVTPRIGGAITKHPLAPAVAEALARELRQVGAEAKVWDPCDPSDDRVFVYLAGCAFQKGDLPSGA